MVLRKVDIVLRKVDAERKATLTATQGLYRGLLDTKPTPETARMNVRVDMERLYIETLHVGIADLAIARRRESLGMRVTRPKMMPNVV